MVQNLLLNCCDKDVEVLRVCFAESSECDDSYVNMTSASKSPVSPRERSHMTHNHDDEAYSQRDFGFAQSVWLKATLGWKKRQPK